MGVLFGILITIMVIDADVGIIAFIVYHNTWGDTSCNIACACGCVFMILLFIILFTGLIACDPKVGTGR